MAGHDVADEPEAVRLRIGVALQDAALDDKQTGASCCAAGPPLRAVQGGDRSAGSAPCAQLVDIGDALDDRIGTYSGGMKRRLDLAAGARPQPDGPVPRRADHRPRPDQPGSVVWEEVRRLNDELGMTIFLTTQYLEEADELADRVGIIRKGRIVAEGTPEELKRSVGTDLIVVRVDSDVDAAARCPRRAGRGRPHRSARRRAGGVRRRRRRRSISPVAAGAGRGRRQGARPLAAHADARRRVLLRSPASASPTPATTTQPAAATKEGSR